MHAETLLTLRERVTAEREQPSRPIPPRQHVLRSEPSVIYDSWPYHRPVIFTSLGALEPRSVSEGWMLSNTPAISLVSGSTYARHQSISHPASSDGSQLAATPRRRHSGQLLTSHEILGVFKVRSVRVHGVCSYEQQETQGQ